MNLPASYIERVAGRDVVGAIERAKRLRRRGWNVALVEEIATGDVVTLGVLDPHAEPEPDRRGQYELPLD